MYTGEFNNGDKFEGDFFLDGVEYEYIGMLGDEHFVLFRGSSSADPFDDDELRKHTTRKIGEPKTLTGYVNIYPGINPNHETREEADLWFGRPGRIACKRVTITYNEGEFDE